MLELKIALAGALFRHTRGLVKRIIAIVVFGRDSFVFWRVGTRALSSGVGSIVDS